MNGHVGGKPKLLIIGVDAGSPELFQRWCADGSMPNLQRLMRTGVTRCVENPYCLEAGSVWPVLQSGLMPGRQPQYDGRRAFDTTRYSARWYAPNETAPTVWRQLSDQGVRCLLIDPPYLTLDAAIVGTMVVDWGVHVPANGSVFEFATHPPETADEIRRVVGEAPGGQTICDRMGPETIEEHERFRDLYMRRIMLKGALAKHLMQSTSWDVAFIGSSDLHCTGHHLWHVNDPRHPDYSRKLEAALGEPIRDCYRAFDESLGEMLDDLPDDVTVMLIGSHGMGPSFSGTGLLDRILQRLDQGVAAKPARTAKGSLRALWHRVPKEQRGWLKPLRRPFKGMLRPGVFLDDHRHRRYFEVYANNATGGIRLNMKGRESDGCVEAEEAEALILRLTAELRSIVNVDTGEPLVADVIVTRQWYPGPHLSQLPDMLVRWNRSAPIKRVYSEAIGELSQQYDDNRTGDHTPDGICVVAGSAVGAAGTAPAIRTVDFAPTIADFFGVELGEHDGHAFGLTTVERGDAPH